MLTLTFLSQKGGAGKTTLACAVAVAGEAAGRATVLIDLDPQGTASKWFELREAETPVVTPTSPERLAAVLGAAHTAGAQLVVIDTAPQVSEAALEAARAADMVLIPCRPSAADLTAIGASVELARAAAVPTHAILNAAPVRNPLTEQAREAIARYGINTVPAVIHQRIDHMHAYTAGLSATELAPRSKAARELEALFAWIIQGALL